MLTIRPVQWPRDAALLSGLDTTVETQWIYNLVRENLSVDLVAVEVKPALRKRYDFQPDDPGERQNWDCAVIAEEDGHLAGFAAAQYTIWNRRVVLWHLYVMPFFRGQKVGTRLLEAVATFAQSVDARCLWLETQNVNYPAIQFYLKSGFAFCGFDASLYDPRQIPSEEVALFFARPVGG